jgi:malonyl-CoA/methylmalonyl-CoA synthetase
MTACDRARRAWEVHLGHPPPADLHERLAAGTLPACFAATAAAHADRPAIAVDGACVTHAELDDRLARVAGRLAAHGVARGDRVLLAGPSSLDLVVAYLAILRAGAVVVPADAAATPRELAHLLDHSGALVACAAGDAYGRLASAVPTLLALDDAALGAGDALRVPELDADDPAVLAYTSGTTGRPKGVPLTHANLLASTRGAMAAWRWTADDVLVHALPLSHQHGLSGVHATLLAGSCARLLGRFDPERLTQLAERERATVLFAVPAMYERLVESSAFAAADLSSLRLWVSGSAALSPALAERVRALLGDVPLERYGSTEAGLDVSNPYAGERRPGAVGLPLPGVELAVVDRGGREVSDGEDGEIALRGPQVFSGYWREPEATAESFLPGGWFLTGDLGCVDPADGALRITGRRKELIVSGGLNVYPREVELALEEHASVARAGVAGVSSTRWGEEVVAAVVLAPGHTLDEDRLRRHLRDRLAPYKCPKRVLALDALPVNRMGKLQRTAVAGLFAPAPTTISDPDEAAI